VKDGRLVNALGGAHKGRQWWEHPWLLAGLVLLAGVPLLYPSVPPLIDLPGHMARYYVQLHLGLDPNLQRHYDFHWRLIGNLGVDAWVAAFGPLIGLGPAVKSIVILIPMLSIVGMLAIVRVVVGRIAPTAFFALPYAYSIFFQFGAVNSMLAQALALLAFASWYWLESRGHKRGAVVVLFIASIVIWLCHMLGWLTLCLLVFGAQIAMARGSGRRWPMTIVVALLRCLPMAVPALITLHTLGGASGNDPPAGWFNWTNKLGTLATALQDRWQWFDIAGFILVMQIIAQGLFNPVHALNPVLKWATMMCTLALIGLPYIASGGVYLDVRMCWIVILMAILMIDFNVAAHPKVASRLALAGIGFFVLRMATQTYSYVALDTAWKAELAALSAMPSGSRVAALVPVGCAGPVWSDRFNHLASLALIDKGVITNDRFTGGAQMLSLKSPVAPDFEQDPAQLVEDQACPHPAYPDVATQLKRLPRNAFDYIWVIGMNVPFAPPSDTHIVWRRDRSMVLKIDHPNGH
jgi:hypothetical protein